MGFSLVHSGLLIACLLLAFGVSWCSFRLMLRSHAWGDRRSFQLLCLGAPVLILSVLGGVIAAMLVRGCQHFTVDDSILAVLLLGAAGAILSVGFVSITWRFCSIHRLLAQLSIPRQDERVQRILEALGSYMAVRSPKIRLIETDYPVACLVGISRPEILLSSWMLENLDDAELEAVLAHELAHLKHLDNLLAWLMAWIKEGCFYLPIVHKTIAQFQRDREFFSDSRAIRTTNKPMALASALLKVWKQGQATNRPFLAQEAEAWFCEDAAVSLEARVQRLLDSSAMLHAPAFSPRAWSALALGILLVLAALLPLYLMPSGSSSCLMMAL